MTDFLDYFLKHAVGFTDLNLGLQIGWGLLFANMLLVTIRGGLVERTVLLVICVSFYVAQYVYYNTSHNVALVPLLTVDAVVIMVLLPVALYSNRYWPMWFLSILSIAFFVDVALFASGQLNMWKYWLISNASNDAIMATMMVGTLVEPKQRPWGWVIDAGRLLARAMPRR
jgi:hypothetical protein